MKSLSVIIFLSTFLFEIIFAQQPPKRYTKPLLNDSTQITNPPPTEQENKEAQIENENFMRKKIEDVYDDNTRNAIDSYWQQRFMKSPEFLICILLLIFAIVLFIIHYRLFINGKIDSSQITRLNLITLIIIGTLFLIAAGYDREQILSAMGLFGTIAGYLLGKSSNSTQAVGNTANQPQTTPPNTQIQP